MTYMERSCPTLEPCWIPLMVCAIRSLGKYLASTDYRSGLSVVGRGFSAGGHLQREVSCLSTMTWAPAKFAKRLILRRATQSRFSVSVHGGEQIGVLLIESYVIQKRSTVHPRRSCCEQPASQPDRTEPHQTTRPENRKILDVATEPDPADTGSSREKKYFGLTKACTKRNSF